MAPHHKLNTSNKITISSTLTMVPLVEMVMVQLPEIEAIINSHLCKDFLNLLYCVSNIKSCPPGPPSQYLSPFLVLSSFFKPSLLLRLS